MVQRTVLKVSMPCLKCKKEILKSVSTIEGIDKIEIDKEKETVTVTGNADPYDIIVRIRKSGKHVEVVSVGPPPAPPKKPDDKKPDDKKPDDKKPDDKKKPEVHDPLTCLECRRMVFVPMGGYPCYQEPGPSCSIM